MSRVRNHVARNDRANLGRSPPPETGELQWPSGNETTNRNIADEKRVENVLAGRAPRLAVTHGPANGHVLLGSPRIRAGPKSPGSR